jgi:hypothetical protein
MRKLRAFRLLEQGRPLRAVQTHLAEITLSERAVQQLQTARDMARLGFLVGYWLSRV